MISPVLLPGWSAQGKMKDKLLIYGASGHGKVIIDIVEREERYEIAGLLDDNTAKGKSL